MNEEKAEDINIVESVQNGFLFKVKDIFADKVEAKKNSHSNMSYKVALKAITFIVIDIEGVNSKDLEALLEADVNIYIVNRDIFVHIDDKRKDIRG